MGGPAVRLGEVPLVLTGSRCCSGVVLTGFAQTAFSSRVRTVTFTDIPASYKPGIPFQGKVAGPARFTLCPSEQNSNLASVGR